MDSPGQSAIDIKEFASRIVALEALGKPAKSPVPRVTGPEICALVYRAPMYRERLGGIKGMRPAESLEPISLFPGSTFLDVPCDFVVRSIRPVRISRTTGGAYLVLAPTLSQLVAGFDALLIQPSGPRQKALQPRCYFPNVFTARLPPSTPLDLAILHTFTKTYSPTLASTFLTTSDRNKDLLARPFRDPPLACVFFPVSAYANLAIEKFRHWQCENHPHDLPTYPNLSIYILQLKRLMCAYCVGHDTPTQESSVNDR
ncbi:hypothetical protein ALC62_13828 [Cyphomyrmex costatus]|uniref:Uncharacterized protein n=1 Tax=Cyphomyrmex costatus TaxID=456900 RepID=A0A195C454_9HYME|nr:hypothetical protein ALC62_13828 [Cyphomyrmex costatus]